MTSTEQPARWSTRRAQITSRWLLPFEMFEWSNEWLAYALSRWAFVDVLDYLSRFAIVFAVGFYFWGASDRLKQKHYLAWQIINLAAGKGGNGGRKDALRDLAEDGVSLKGIDVSGAELSRLKLSNADLGYSNLLGADLNGADLTGSYVGWAHLEYDCKNAMETHFWKATLKWMNFNYSNLWAVDLGHANLEASRLENVNLSNAYLGDANLKGADLIGADLRQAGLKGADLSGAYLSHARLDGADLTNALLDQDQIDSACVDDATILPSGLHRPKPCVAIPKPFQKDCKSQ